MAEKRCEMCGAEGDVMICPMCESDKREFRSKVGEAWDRYKRHWDGGKDKINIGSEESALMTFSGWEDTHRDDCTRPQKNFRAQEELINSVVQLTDLFVYRRSKELNPRGDVWLFSHNSTGRLNCYIAGLFNVPWDDKIPNLGEWFHEYTGMRQNQIVSANRYIKFYQIATRPRDESKRPFNGEKIVGMARRGMEEDGHEGEAEALSGAILRRGKGETVRLSVLTKSVGDVVSRWPLIASYVYDAIKAETGMMPTIILTKPVAREPL